MSRTQQLEERNEELRKMVDRLHQRYEIALLELKRLYERHGYTDDVIKERHEEAVRIFKTPKG